MKPDKALLVLVLLRRHEASLSSRRSLPEGERKAIKELRTLLHIQLFGV